jgi:hypothetical protein
MDRMSGGDAVVCVEGNSWRGQSLRLLVTAVHRGFEGCFNSGWILGTISGDDDYENDDTRTRIDTEPNQALFIPFRLTGVLASVLLVSGHFRFMDHRAGCS